MLLWNNRIKYDKTSSKKRGTLLRPAQNCDGAYGKETIMYEMNYDGSQFIEKELYRILPNEKMCNGEVLHTYNEYNGLCVIDGFQHEHPLIFKIETKFANIITT